MSIVKELFIEAYEETMAEAEEAGKPIYAPLVTPDCPLEWEKAVRNKDTGRQYRVTVKLEEV